MALTGLSTIAVMTQPIPPFRSGASAGAKYSLPGLRARRVYRAQLQPRGKRLPVHVAETDLGGFCGGEQFRDPRATHPVLCPFGHLIPRRWCAGPGNHPHRSAMPQFEDARVERAQDLEAAVCDRAVDRRPRPPLPVNRARQHPHLRNPTRDRFRRIKVVRHPVPQVRVIQIGQQHHISSGPIIGEGSCGEQYLGHGTDGRNRVGVSPNTRRSHSLHHPLTPRQSKRKCSRCLHFVLTPAALPAHTTNTSLHACHTLT